MNRTTIAKACLVSTVLLACFTDADETSSKPKVKRPFPGNRRTIPYEDVLDHCDVILAGTLRKLETDRLVVEVSEALRGDVDREEVEIGFTGTWRGDPAERPHKDKPATFFCLKDETGRLCMAGNPPKAGGFVLEGPEYVRKLMQAAADPERGYRSEDPVVRFSSAYRLAAAWLAKPGKERGAPPGELIDAIGYGLVPGRLRGRHMNAAARDTFNRLLKCDINRLVGYSVNRSAEARTEHATQLYQRWSRTADAVRGRRARRTEAQQATPEQIRGLLERLGSYYPDDRKAARQKLLQMGAAARGQVQARAESGDADIARECKSLLERIDAAIAFPHPEGQTFDLDISEPFVGEHGGSGRGL